MCYNAGDLRDSESWEIVHEFEFITAEPSQSEVTLLSNIFIDDYMPEANGEFVKVYIYLLRALSTTPVSFSLEEMADRLICTERDILRALKYWARQELLALDFAPDKSLRGIALLLPKQKPAPEPETAGGSAQTACSVQKRSPYSRPGKGTKAKRRDRPASLHSRTVYGQDPFSF